MPFPNRRADDLDGGGSSAEEKPTTTGDNRVSYLRYPIKNADKHKAIIKFTSYKESENYGKESIIVPGEANNHLQADTPETVCTLFLPKTISVSDGAEHSSTALGLIGSNIEKYVSNKGIEGISSHIIDQTKDALESILKTGVGVVQGKEINTVILAKVIQQSKFSNRASAQALTLATRRVANPHLRSIFQQVKMRTFSYDFEMFADNAQEAAEIDRIVKFFRASVYPEKAILRVNGEDVLTEDGNKIDDIAYKFPNRFGIEYKYDGKEIGHKIKYCYLTDVKTDFNSQGQMAFHADGQFISTKIALTFQEERTLTKEDILEGY